MIRPLSLALVLIPITLSDPSSSALAEPRGGTITGSVVVNRGKEKYKDQSHVWVYLRSHTFDFESQTKKNQKIVQRSMAFTPRVQVVPRGSIIAFPNEDNLTHNVFSNGDIRGEPKGAGYFNLYEFGARKSKDQTFALVGEYPIYCNIHPEMVAHVKVVNSDWIAPVTNGSFRIDNVPPGTYEVVAWRPNSNEVSSKRVVVTAGGTTKVAEIPLVWGDEVQHLRRDGTPYPQPGYSRKP